MPTPRKTPAEKSNNPPQSTPSKPSKAPRKLGVKKSNPSKEASTAKEAKDFHPKASKPWITRPKPHTKKYTDTHKYESGIAGNLPDVSKIDKVFLKIIEKLMPLGLEHTLEMLDNRPLNIATMCSGTEAPVLCFRLTNQGKSKFEFSTSLEYDLMSSRSPRTRLRKAASTHSQVQRRNCGLQATLYLSKLWQCSHFPRHHRNLAERRWSNDRVSVYSPHAD